MGRAMLIIVTGLMVSLGYTFMGMSSQRSLLNQQSVNSATKSLAQNLSHTGVQFAIGKFSDDSTWRGPETITLEGGETTISIREITAGSIIEITSTAKMDGAYNTHTVVSTFDISQKEQLIPDFDTSLGITTDNFNFILGGSSKINGYDKTGQCSDAPGVQVNSTTGYNNVGTNTRIDGTPEDEAAINSTPYDPYAKLVKRLENQPESQKISGSYKGDLGTIDDPGIFFIEEYTKLTGGISEGYGIMVIRSGGELALDGELDIAGNFTFNGLVIFENAWHMDANGTPTINGSVIVGSTDESFIDIDINGDVQLQYDCTAKQYADLVAQKSADRIYKKIGFYE